MNCSVELYLDSASSERINNFKMFLKKEGVAIEENVKPHISLAVYNAPDETWLKEQVLRFSKRKINLHFPIFSIGFFPTEEFVLFLSPKVTPQMLSIHSDFLNETADFKENLLPYYDTDKWVPHITLAIGLSQAEQQRAFMLTAKFQALPMAAIERIGISTFPPNRYIFEAPFAKI